MESASDSGVNNAPLRLLTAMGGETYRGEKPGIRETGQPENCPERPTIVLMWQCLARAKTA
ncbi:hypothetical protein ETR_11663 [Erwinia tracheiphila PSU-1]|nr:hypothetical protein ETR_11663 [Erwinia tracheiphila PSU-1]